MQMKHCNIGMIGVSVMGANLARNLRDHGYRVAVYDRDAHFVTALMQDDAQAITPCSTLSQLVTVTAIHKFIIAAACSEIFALIVTPFWKISLHMIGMGCITAMFYLLNIAGMGQMFWALVVSIICSGALASARLQLQSHNLAQIAAGFFGGFIIAMIAILFI